MRTKKTIRKETFLEMVSELMKLEEMRYASPKVLSEKLAEKHGGQASTYLTRIYSMRLKLADFRNEKGDVKC